jgi:hypothetical protein
MSRDVRAVSFSCPSAWERFEIPNFRFKKEPIFTNFWNLGSGICHPGLESTQETENETALPGCRFGVERWSNQSAGRGKIGPAIRFLSPPEWFMRRNAQGG